jgi:hypothetical protein
MSVRFWAKVERRGFNDCWPWLGCTTATGYGVTSLAGRTVTAHRKAYVLAHGATDAACICHTCDNPPCCNPAHLWAGSVLENMRDKIGKGRAHFAPLTEAQARRAKFGTEKICDLAREFGVSETAVSFIRSGRRWAWLKPLDEAA